MTLYYFNLIHGTSLSGLCRSFTDCNKNLKTKKGRLIVERFLSPNTNDKLINTCVYVRKECKTDTQMIFFLLIFHRIFHAVHNVYVCVFVSVYSSEFVLSQK